METSTWIAIYMPLFILLFVIIPHQREIQRALRIRIRKRKGERSMTNEIIKKYIGKTCRISTGPFGTNVAGEITEVNENWIEVKTKKGNELVNAEYVQSIKAMD